MITNVPDARAFSQHGLMFLNLAWNTVFDLLLHYSEAKKSTPVIEKLGEEYWAAARSPLSIAHALAQQGAELVLKAVIADVSPFLLVSAPPRDWPRGSGSGDTPFSDFRTIDAQDLIRACSTVRGTPLPAELATTFEKFRKQRNAVFHTIDERLAFSDKEIIRYVLDVSHLIEPCQWPRIRRSYIEETPLYCTLWPGGALERVCLEMAIVVELSEASKLREWFGFDKKQRCYNCPRCYEEFDNASGHSPPRSAQLKPNTPSSQNLYCFVCGGHIPVVRRSCQNSECKGNVINAEGDFECLTCGEAQEQGE